MSLFESNKTLFEQLLNASIKVKNNPQQLFCLPTSSKVTWNWNLGYNAELLLTKSISLEVVEAASGAYGSIDITQDSVGSHTITLPSNSIVVNGGGGVITLTGTPGSKDTLNYKRGSDGILRWTVLSNFN